MVLSLSGGSQLYITPEQVRNLDEGQEYKSAADHWSLGVCLIALAAGHFPQDFTKDQKVLPKRLEGGMIRKKKHFLSSIFQNCTSTANLWGRLLSN